MASTIIDVFVDGRPYISCEHGAKVCVMFRRIARDHQRCPSDKLPILCPVGLPPRIVHPHPVGRQRSTASVDCFRIRDNAVGPLWMVVVCPLRPSLESKIVLFSLCFYVSRDIYKWYLHCSVAIDFKSPQCKLAGRAGNLSNTS